MMSKKISPSMAYAILNCLRFFNVVSLLCVQVATWVMIVMSGTTNQFYFFDGATQFLVFLWAFFLMFTELTFIKFTKKWIHKNWPVFSDEHSFLWFGLMMMGLSCNVLGNLNNPTFSIENLTLPWWRVVLASGILTMTFGVFNIIASIIFRDPKEKITARMYRSKGAMAGTLEQSGGVYDDFNSQKLHADDYEKEQSSGLSKLKRMTKRFTLHRSKPEISAPVTYNTAGNADVEAGRPSYDSFEDDRRSPVAPNVERPPTRMHPVYTPGNRESQYSEANMSRFTAYAPKRDGSQF